MKVKLSKAQIGIIVAIVILAIILISGGAVCIVKDEPPSVIISDIMKNNNDKIIGKWQSTDNDALFAYEFFEDGTYKNHSFIGLNFSGEYEVKGNKLTLRNPEVSKEIIYKISINDDKLKLKKFKEDGKDAKDTEPAEFKRVERINLKGFNEYMNELKNKKQSEKQDNK